MNNKKSSLDYRRDVRSVAVFKKNIKEETEKEKIWAIALQYDFCEKNPNNPCYIEERGVDNSGELIEGKLSKQTVDKTFRFKKGNFINIEIKTIPEYLDKFMTIKASALRVCINEKGWLVIPKKNIYYIFPTRTCKHLYDNFNHKIYWDFEKNRGFSPNDKAVRIFSNHIEEFLKQDSKKGLSPIIRKTWGEKAKNYIESNWGLLSKERAR